MNMEQETAYNARVPCTLAFGLSNQMKRKLKILLVGLMLASFIYSIDTSVLGFLQEQPKDGVQLLWTLVFSLVLGLWIKHDPDSGSFDKPFDMAFYVMIGWPVVLPYYLCITRGVLKGLMTCLGFLFIFSWPYLVGTLIQMLCQL